MTAAEAIAQADALEPNQYTQAQKLVWLAELDGQLSRELIERHAGEGDAEGVGPCGAPVGGDPLIAPQNENGGETPPHQSASLTASPQGEAYEADSDLLVPSPWAGDLYRWALIAQFRLHNAEIERYNQAAALFAAARRQYADDLNRRRRPLGERRWKM